MANLSIYSHLLQPKETLDVAGSIKNGMSLRQLSMQNDRMGKQMKREDDAAAQAEHLRKASVFGSALDSLSGLPEQERAQAWGGVKKELVAQGIDPSMMPDQYDPGFYRSTLDRFYKSKEGMERQSALLDQQFKKSQIAKNYAEAQKERNSKGLALTPGQKKVDEAFSGDSADYYYSGGKATVEKNFQRLGDSINKLNSNKDLTGGLSTKIPWFGEDKQQDWVNPEMASVRDDVRSAIQGSLKQILGAQFTEKEAESMFSRAFNPRLSSEENARRATAELEALKRMAGNKDAAQKYFMAHGTLVGFQPGGTNLEQSPATMTAKNGGGSGSFGMNEAQASSAPVQFKPGTKMSGYVFNGGDPTDEKNWKKASR